MSIFSGLQIITEPELEPVSLADARAHARVTTDLEDQLLAGYLVTAREYCEQWTRKAFMLQGWRYTLSGFPGRDYTNQRSLSSSEALRNSYIEIPKPPLVEIISFLFIDSGGTVHYMTEGYGNASGNYLLDTQSEPGRVVLPFSGIWPTAVLLPSNPIQITYRCGYPAFSGTCNIDENGIVTLASGDAFDARLAGRWITIRIGDTDQSFTILKVLSPYALTLSGSTPKTPIDGAAFSTNLVPMKIRTAILLVATHLYDNRESAAVSEGRLTYEDLPTLRRFLGMEESRAQRR